MSTPQRVIERQLRCADARFAIADGICLLTKRIEGIAMIIEIGRVSKETQLKEVGLPFDGTIIAGQMYRTRF
jgi:hypothetical protein